MIDRYATEEIADIWSEAEKFRCWLETELAVLEARVKAGDLDDEVYADIFSHAAFSLNRISEIEADTQHDLLAFVQSVQESLSPAVRGEFHRRMTSYDTEEIPMNLRIQASLRHIFEALDELRKVLGRQADTHRRTLMVGQTHGQDAEPITFGLRLLSWQRMFSRDRRRLDRAYEDIGVGKISGAVGTYGELSPDIEAAVCVKLGLRPVDQATQIIHRDRIAEVMMALAILAANLEHVAVNFRLMATTRVRELREPFGKKQKGSSRMPHKHNTILTERMNGLGRVVRAFASVALENIPTWGERDISQSAPERIILPDAFHLIHYMLRKLTYVVDKMEVFPARMLENLADTQECIYSGPVKDLLLSWGLDAEVAYRLVQETSFTAMEKRRPFSELLAATPAIATLLDD